MYYLVIDRTRNEALHRKLVTFMDDKRGEAKGKKSEGKTPTVVDEDDVPAVQLAHEVLQQTKAMS